MSHTLWHCVFYEEHSDKQIGLNGYSIFRPIDQVNGRETHMNSETCCRLAVILLKLQFFNPSHRMRPALFAEFASLQWSWQPGFCAGFKTWKIMEEWNKSWHSQKKSSILLFVYPRLGKRYESGLAIHNPSRSLKLLKSSGMGHDYFLPLKNPPIRSFEIEVLSVMSHRHGESLCFKHHGKSW